ncbi:MAG TPA: substrate-binding domain-containing protein [Acidobacteriaceae bacterium]|nr:substrate-binding domain-containing protein [Acidobacteriaceae bacterium]
MTTQAGAGITIGLSVHSIIDPRWERDVTEIPSQARQMGVKLLLENASSSAIRQIQQCEKLLADGVQALIILAQDGSASSKAVEMANARGVPVIAYERMILNCDLPLYVGFDTAKVGEQLCRYALQHAPRGNYIILDGDAKDNNAVILRQVRQKMMKAAIESGQIQPVLESWVDGWSMSLAWQLTRDALKKNPQIACVLAASDNLAEGASQALHDMKMQGSVVVTGQDAVLSAVVRILQGQQTMSIYKPIPLLAKTVMECAIALVNKKPVLSTRAIDNGKRSVASVLINELPVVDKNNAIEVVTGPLGSYTSQQIYSRLPQALRPTGTEAVLGR